MKLVTNPDWGPNFEFRLELSDYDIHVGYVPRFGTTDDGAIILRSKLDDNLHVALIPVGMYLWIKLYSESDPVYHSYFIGAIEDILDEMDLEPWEVIAGEDIIAGHGLTEMFEVTGMGLNSMANMSYCKFQNTLADLMDCRTHMDDEKMSSSELSARFDLVQLCGEIFEEYAYLLEKDDQEE